MAQHAKSGNRRAILGMTLLTVGVGAAVVNLGSLLFNLLTLACVPAACAGGFISGVGISLLHSIQAVAFDPSILSSVLSEILVSFSAFVIVAAGTSLLRNPFSGAPAQQRLGSTASVEGN